MNARHIWEVTYEDGSRVPGSCPWYVATPAYRLAEKTQATATAIVTRDGKLYRTYERTEA